VSALTPDERRDVVVHQFKAIDALTGDPVGERWSVWLGRDNEGSFDTEGEALAAARAIAEEHGVPAWLARHNEAIVRITSAL
jgi:protein-disulfide isomerase-like protein with CxxC motif